MQNVIIAAKTALIVKLINVLHVISIIIGLWTFPPINAPVFIDTTTRIIILNANLAIILVLLAQMPLHAHPVMLPLIEHLILVQINAGVMNISMMMVTINCVSHAI